jgi:chitodextrinase
MKHTQKTSHKRSLIKTVLAVTTVSLMLLVGFYVFSKPATVAAATANGCTVPSGGGTDSFDQADSPANGINIPATGTYYLWLRMESPDGTNNSLGVSVDDGSCITMGTTMAANTWTWDNNESGNTTAVVMNLTAGYHTMVVTGTNGMSLDTFLFTQQTPSDCTPTGITSATDCQPTLPISAQPYYLNVGGPGYTDSQGRVWQADTGQYVTQDNTYGSTSGVTTASDGSGACTTTLANTNCTTKTIAGTTNQKVYQDERWGLFHYDIPVANGTYTVVLNLDEINPSSVGSGGRILNVSIEGNAVLTNYNMDAVGAYTANDQSFTVTVTNGDLNIDMNSSGVMSLTGLEVLPQNGAPAVSISAPTANTIASETIPLSAAASDTVDGVNVGSPITSAPYTYNWNTTSVSNGSHVITAIATNSAGVTTTSAPVTITIANNSCLGTPLAPTNLTDTDSASSPPASKVDLSWSAVTAPVNCTLAGYNIYRSTGKSTTVTKLITTTTYTDSTVAAGTNYSYQVSALDTSGNSPESSLAPTTPVSVTTGVNCSSSSSTLPTTPTLTANGGVSYTSIALSWTASTVSNGCSLVGYHLYRSGTTAAIYTGAATSFSDTGIDLTPANLASGTAYSYYVVAYDSGSNLSTNSATATATTEVDNVAPTTPTGLAASATSSAAVSLNWTASTDLPNPGAVGVSGYYIYRNDSVTPTYTVTGGATTFTDSNVLPSTTYKYAVQAFDKNSNPSSESADVSVTTPAAPASCTNTSPAPSTPGSLTSPSQTMTSVSLSWTASTVGAGSNCAITGYQVTDTTTGNQSTVTGTSFTDTGLSPSASYSYLVVAVESNGLKSTTAASLTKATLSDTQAPTAPTNFVASAPSASQVSLSWTAATDNVGVTKYVLTRGSTVVTLGTVTSYIDNTVSASTSYTYSLVAYDGAGNPSTAATATVTTPAPTCSGNPSTPSGLSAPLVSASSVGLTWNASTPASGCTIKGYEVFRGTTDLTPNLVSSPSYSDTGLSAKTGYNYTIVAVDTSNHDSSASNALSVTTLASTGTCTTTLIADVNRDCHVNFNDLAAFAYDYPTYNGKSVATGTDGDLDYNGTVSFSDLTLFAQYYPLENGQ